MLQTHSGCRYGKTEFTPHLQGRAAFETAGVLRGLTSYISGGSHRTARHAEPEPCAHRLTGVCQDAYVMMEVNGTSSKERRSPHSPQRNNAMGDRRPHPAREGYRGVQGLGEPSCDSERPPTQRRHAPRPAAANCHVMLMPSFECRRIA